ncbi:uncharacterized protein ARMOST_13636 [Armillaria ostoyae]|uniref:Uncharacterized protein n=1 Tax=Armillaria ostoyae TaxID=47428 RepID=A0A284RNA0_ARMOS|nr:uncharacterized protein ARMOST_13636 [Armillaria ostoyae]
MIAKDLLTGAHLSSAGRSQSFFIGTPFNPISITTHSDSLTTHSDIPAMNLLALNVSRMTSTPVSESQNRYAALSIDECNDDNIPLKGCNDALPARAEAKAVNPAGHEAESLSTLPLRKLGQTEAKRHTSSLRGVTQPMKVLNEKSPTIVTPINTASLPRRTDGTCYGQKGAPLSAPHEASSRHEQAALTQRSPITTVGIESRLDGALENTARKTQDEEAMAGVAIMKDTLSKSVVAPESVSLRGEGETGKSVFAVQAQPVVCPNNPLIMALGHSMPH